MRARPLWLILRGREGPRAPTGDPPYALFFSGRLKKDESGCERQMKTRSLALRPSRTKESPLLPTGDLLLLGSARIFAPEGETFAVSRAFLRANFDSSSVFFSFFPQVSRSNLTSVRLSSPSFSSEGVYRCEVTSAEDYEMAVGEASPVRVVGK